MSRNGPCQSYDYIALLLHIYISKIFEKFSTEKKCEWVVPRTVIIEFSLDFIEVSLEFLHPKTQDKNYIIQYPATENNSQQQIDYILSNSETIGWKKKEGISCWRTKYILLVESAASCKYSLHLAEFRWMD